MTRKANLSIGKRYGLQEIESLKSRIELEYPDPVMRLAQGKEKGKSQQPDLNKAYEGMDILRPPFSMAIMARLLDLDPYLAGAVNAIATDVSACDMEIKWTGEGDEKKEERKKLEEFFFESSDPTNPMSLNEKIKSCATDYISLGSWNLEIVEGGQTLIDLVHAPAEFVRVKKSMTGFVMVKNNEKVEFSQYGDPNRDKKQNQILRAINKMPGHRVYGKPETYALVNTVLMNSLRDEKNLHWFDQGVLADLLVLIEENIEIGIRDQIVADYQNTSDGSQTMYILDGVGKSAVEQIKRDLEGKAFETLEGNNRQRVLTALRVPPAKAAIYEDANRANTLTQDEVFQNEVTKPIQKTFKVRFDHLIKHGFEFENWEFVLKPLSLRDRKEEALIEKIYLDKAVHSINETKAMLNEPPVKGGDRRLINTPLGLVDIDTWEIAVAAPEVNPETAERLAKTGTVDFVGKLIDLRKEIQKFKKG